MDAHQRAMWQRMLDQIDAYRAGLTDLRVLVADLRGLFIEADPHDPGLRREFEWHWGPIDAELELRTEPWAPPGQASDTALDLALLTFATRVKESVLADPTDEHA